MSSSFNPIGVENKMLEESAQPEILAQTMPKSEYFPEEPYMTVIDEVVEQQDLVESDRTGRVEVKKELYGRLVTTQVITEGNGEIYLEDTVLLTHDESM
jgi:hypothetical protein